ncbi:MAG: beta-galactosidase [Tepidisphaeraceae bacterium]|jgi:hypothetical protein
MQLSRRQCLGLAGSALIASQWPRSESLSDLVFGAVNQTQPANGPTRWQTRASEKRKLANGITWLTHEPIEFIIRRDGNKDPNLAKQYEAMCDPENIKRMAAAGVRWGRIFFYKGFGLQYEKAHMDIAHRVADQLHALGMKVSLYVGGTMFIETLYKEVPEAESWEQRDCFGQSVPYGNQTFRHFACPNEPAYRGYIKKVLDIAVNDFHADELAFDNFVLQEEPKSCRCPRCMKAFAEFLRAKYPDKLQVAARFGESDIDAVQIKPWPSADAPGKLTALDDPILQEWTRFRCQSLANSAADLYGYVKSQNPGVACLLNIKGLYSFNRYWAAGVYHPMFAGAIDIMAFDTGGYDARIDATTGALVSQIRSYKVARGIGTSCEDSFADDIRAAIHMSFGYQKPLAGNIAAPYGSEAFNVFTPLVEFFREYNDRFYTETDNVADVAVLHNWPSMAYSINATAVPVTLMEQVLIQYKLPFDILFDEQMDRLGKYPAVVLAGQECVSDAQAQTLLDYVRKGGTLVVTGNTGQYNDWRKPRDSNPLLPARREGKGQIVFIPEITRADTGKKPSRMDPAQWVLPKNHAEIYQAIASNLPGGASINSQAPLTTVMEMLVRAKTKETIVHFINFDKKTAPAPFGVDVKKQFPTPVKTVACYSAQTDEPVSLDFKESAGRVSFTVLATKVYAMVVIACA